MTCFFYLFISSKDMHLNMNSSNLYWDCLQMDTWMGQSHHYALQGEGTLCELGRARTKGAPRDWKSVVFPCHNHTAIKSLILRRVPFLHPCTFYVVSWWTHWHLLVWFWLNLPFLAALYTVLSALSAVEDCSSSDTREKGYCSVDSKQTMLHW